jgi:hypothetical protein
MSRPRLFETMNFERCRDRDSLRPRNLEFVETVTSRVKVVETETLSRVSLITVTNLVPEAGDDDGDVTDATDDHEEDIGDSKAVVAHSGHSEKIPSIFLKRLMILLPLILTEHVQLVQELCDVLHH